jgi:hypothetical protein
MNDLDTMRAEFDELMDEAHGPNRAAHLESTRALLAGGLQVERWEEKDGMTLAVVEFPGSFVQAQLLTTIEVILLDGGLWRVASVMAGLGPFDAPAGQVLLKVTQA